MTDVYKRYGGVRALQGASLEVTTGEVHGLLGPNGSGKSTMNKVLSGTVRPDEATIKIDGKTVEIARPRDAAEQEVSSVYQQLSLVPELNISNNVLLGTNLDKLGFIDQKARNKYATEAMERFWPYLDEAATLETEIADLSPGSQQLVEIAKAVARNPRLLVLDEATASLRKDQVDFVFEIIRELTARSVAVIFVSHRMEEVAEICDRATILRNGRTVATVDMETTSDKEIVSLMVGDIPELQDQDGTGRKYFTPGDEPPYLEVKDLVAGPLQGATLDAYHSEIVGLGGLQGQGQSALLHTLFGDVPVESGQIILDGENLIFRNPRQAIKAGLSLVPGDRGAQGLLMTRPILENLSIVSLWRRLIAKFFISMRREKKADSREVDRLSIKIGDLMDPVSALSGGNQQKVVIGKWLLNAPDVVLLDDPTKGVDVGAKAEIYAIIRELTAEGKTVILNSSDDQELAELCDRVFVLYEGHVVSTLTGSEITVDNLVAEALRVRERVSVSDGEDS